MSNPLETALNPMLWTQEMSEAWHRSIPNLQAAFKNLRAVALGLPLEYPADYRSDGYITPADQVLILQRDFEQMRQWRDEERNAFLKVSEKLREKEVYAEEKRRLVKAAEVILGLWSETELDPEDEEYEAWMAAFTESVTGWLTEARAALAAPSVAQDTYTAPIPAGFTHALDCAYKRSPRNHCTCGYVDKEGA